MCERFWQIADSVPFPLLVTNGKDGYPQARPMRLLDREGEGLWFATSRSSRKVAEIDADPRVTVLFPRTDHFNYALLRGCAEVVDEDERKHALWRDEWRDDWPSGPTDPDYVLLRVIGEWGSYYYGYADETREIRFVADGSRESSPKTEGGRETAG